MRYLVLSLSLFAIHASARHLPTLEHSKQALKNILGKDPYGVLVRHDATLTDYALREFLIGEKGLDIRTLSRLHSLVEKFSGDSNTYNEMKASFQMLYKESVKLDIGARNKAIENMKALPDDTQPIPTVDEIRRHAAFEDAIDVLVDMRLGYNHRDYTAARQYVLRHLQKLLGVNSKVRRDFVSDGDISEKDIRRIKAAANKLKASVDAEDGKKLDSFLSKLEHDPDSVFPLLKEAIAIVNEKSSGKELIADIKLLSSVRANLREEHTVDPESLAAVEELVDKLKQASVPEQLDKLDRLLDKLQELAQINEVKLLRYCTPVDEC